MKMMLSLVFLYTASLVSLADPPKQAELGQQITTVMRAPYDGKLADLKKHTHPNVLKLMGGEEGLKHIFEFIEKNLKHNGISFDTVAAGLPYSYIKSEKNEFFCVKVKLSLRKANQVQAPSDIIQIAVRPTGSVTWCYLDGSKITIERLRAIFPDLPENFSLTEPEKKIEPEKKAETETKTEQNTIPQ